MELFNKEINQIHKNLNGFEWNAVEEGCNNLIKIVFTNDLEYDKSIFLGLMKSLRKKRQFKPMIRLGDTLSITKHDNTEIEILYAQALIEEAQFASAINILKLLRNRFNTHALQSDQYAEIMGLLGRAYKQLYIKTNYGTSNTSIEFLNKSIKYYYSIYKSNPEGRVWHGVNTVALVALGKRKEIPLELNLDFQIIAKDILASINAKLVQGAADAWDFATAVECCLALNENIDALKWLAGYSSHNSCDTFELASTLRQMEQIWELQVISGPGELIIPLLKAELLKRTGGQLNLNPDKIKSELAKQNIISEQYQAAIEPKENGKLQKVFGQDSFKTYKWYMKGAARCLAVARIGLDSSIGHGTGFLIKGKDLHDSLGEELVLLTNSHVVSTDPLEKALAPEEVTIIFEVLDHTTEFSISEIIWSSPSNKLDTAILRFTESDQKRLIDLTSSIDLYPLSKHLPILNDDQKIYIIGHPRGGTLQLSFQDNQLLDHENPLIHYRTPTDCGSSGSPIFNRTWDLLGLHHAGSENMKCLNGQEGYYSANEGIWIDAIIKAMASEYS